MAFKPGVFLFLRAAAKSVRYFVDEISGEEEDAWVDSTCITSAAYNKQRSEMRITFTDGTKYKYYGISQSYFDDLKDAASKGEQFNYNLRNEGFAYTRLR